MSPPNYLLISAIGSGLGTIFGAITGAVKKKYL